VRGLAFDKKVPVFAKKGIAAGAAQADIVLNRTANRAEGWTEWKTIMER
jgi:hypothetical protein